MTDRITSTQRSLIMSKVKGSDTGIERQIRSLLHKRGFRFRKNVSDLPGKPDIVLPKYKTAIFVHGCFWHQHKNCKKSTRPTSRTEFWNSKLDKNIERDIANERLLKDMGWRVIKVWECEIRKNNIENLIQSLIEQLTN